MSLKTTAHTFPGLARRIRLNPKQINQNNKINPNQPAKQTKLLTAGWGGCDSILLASILDEEDGSSSCAVHGLMGDTQRPPTSADLFKLWTIIASNLAESSDLPPHLRDFAKSCFEEYIKTYYPSANKKMEGELGLNVLLPIMEKFV